MLSIKLFGWSSVCFGSIETLKLSVSVKKRNNRNKLFRNKPKQTETNRKNPKFSEKNTKLCSLSNCFGWSSVCFSSIETSKLAVSVQKRNNRNNRFVSVVSNQNQFRRTPQPQESSSRQVFKRLEQNGFPILGCGFLEKLLPLFNLTLKGLSGQMKFKNLSRIII